MLSPDIGISEMMVIAVVALIVVGPKDLPVLLRRIGQFVAKLRGMANEFRASFEDMARQSELEDLRKEVEAMRTGQFMTPLQDIGESVRTPEVTQIFADIEAGLKSGEINFAPPMGGSSSAQPMIEAPAVKPARKARAKAAVAETAAPPAKARPAAKKAAAKPAASAGTSPVKATAKSAPKVVAKAPPKAKPTAAKPVPAAKATPVARPAAKRRAKAEIVS